MCKKRRMGKGTAIWVTVIWENMRRGYVARYRYRCVIGNSETGATVKEKCCDFLQNSPSSREAHFWKEIGCKQLFLAWWDLLARKTVGKPWGKHR